MIDSLLLRLFVWTSKRWFEAIIFGSNPKDERTSSVHFFTEKKSAKQFIKWLNEARRESK